MTNRWSAEYACRNSSIVPWHGTALPKNNGYNGEMNGLPLAYAMVVFR